MSFEDIEREKTAEEFIEEYVTNTFMDSDRYFTLCRLCEKVLGKKLKHRQILHLFDMLMIAEGYTE